MILKTKQLIKFVDIPVFGCNFNKLFQMSLEAFVKYPISALGCRPRTPGILINGSSSSIVSKRHFLLLRLKTHNLFYTNLSNLLLFRSLVICIGRVCHDRNKIVEIHRL